MIPTRQPGLLENLPQFSLLVLINAFVGSMVGMERSVLPILAEQRYGLATGPALLSFIAAFGLSKALTNLAAGLLAERWGRKPLLVLGWVLALPVPLLLTSAGSWSAVLAANVLLGLSQGLSWSMAVVMKIDLAGPARRGLAMGLNELAGYAAVALAAGWTAALAAKYGLGWAPFLPGLALALVGLLLSALLVEETLPLARSGSAAQGPRPEGLFLHTSLRDRQLSTLVQAGLVNNLNDGVAWGLFPGLFAAAGLGLAASGWLVALYPAVWGLAQLPAGALSDRVGRRPLIAAGMVLQGLALALIALSSALPALALGQVLLGLGTAMVYPTLLAAVSDAAAPAWRAGAVGIYRLWRDLGYALGALLAGLLAAWASPQLAILAVAALTAASGLLAALRLQPEAAAPPAPHASKADPPRAHLDLRTDHT